MNPSIKEKVLWELAVSIPSNLEIKRIRKLTDDDFLEKLLKSDEDMLLTDDENTNYFLIIYQHIQTLPEEWFEENRNKFCLFYNSQGLLMRKSFDNLIDANKCIKKYGIDEENLLLIKI